MRRLDDAQRRAEFAARERTRVAVRQDPQRAALDGRQHCRAERREPSVVGRRLVDDLLRLVAQGVGHGPPIGIDRADRLVAGEHPVHRPAQVHGRRSRVAKRVRRPAERRPTRVRPRLHEPLHGQRDADGRDLSDGRRPADDELLDRVGRLIRPRHPILHERLGQGPLVDDIQRVGIPAERRSEPAGNGRRRRLDARGRVVLLVAAAQELARRLGRLLLEELGGAHDVARGRHHVAREPSEEQPATDIGRRLRVGRARWVGAVGRRHRRGSAARDRADPSSSTG